MNKTKILTITILILAGIYIEHNEIQKIKSNSYEIGEKEGFSLGYNQSELEITLFLMNKGLNCEPITINYNNQSVFLRDVRCVDE